MRPLSAVSVRVVIQTYRSLGSNVFRSLSHVPEIQKMNSKLFVLILTLTAAPMVMAGDPTAPGSMYEITGRIAAPDALWDYASVDAAARRLYVGRIGGVMAVDLDSQSVTPVLVASPLVHAVLPIRDTGLVASTNGEGNTVSIFVGKTGNLVATIPAGHDPDALVLEPKSGLLVAANAEGNRLTLIDVKKLAAVGEIAVGGKPEFLAVDGGGLLYNNIEDRNEVAVIDIAARKIIRKIKLSRCQGPTGLAYDVQDSLLLSVCQNGVVKFIDAKTYMDAATFTVGKGPDAAIFDATRRVAFVPSGADGTLTVFAVRSATDITVRQTLHTKPGTRTGAVDPTTGILYLPSAQLAPPAKPDAWPSVVPGTFAVLIVAPIK
jgi:DNA-binding beta-propeller fold protein YncE